MPKFKTAEEALSHLENYISTNETAIASAFAALKTFGLVPENSLASFTVGSWSALAMGFVTDADKQLEFGQKLRSAFETKFGPDFNGKVGITSLALVAYEVICEWEEKSKPVKVKSSFPKCPGKVLAGLN